MRQPRRATKIHLRIEGAIDKHRFQGDLGESLGSKVVLVHEDDWDQMKRLKSNSALYRAGLIKLVTPTEKDYKAHGVTMDTRAVWASSLVENAFAARYYVYCGVATAINHEANSEGTFGFAGRAFNKFRTTMKSEQLYDTVKAAAREKRKTT
jgi:hypothetical protein